jgi:Asp/Glu/hydantoin racemase
MSGLADGISPPGNVSRSYRGGKTVYGAAVGILMLETRFPRVPGDIGNAGTWPFPVLYRVVRGASPDHVVRHRAEGLLDSFIDAARDLVAQGADGITTNCGFLSLFQAELAAACEVPVATSSLMQVPLIERLLPPDRRVGIITISSRNMSQDHLRAAGVDVATPVVGTDGGREFTRAILDDEPALDVELSLFDLLDAGRRLVDEHPDVGAIVLECTNMVPYAPHLREQLGLPVYSIYTFVQWFHAGLMPRVFESWLLDQRLPPASK